MNRLSTMFVIASTLGSSLVYAACGVPTGPVGCTTGNSDYPYCDSPVPTSNTCSGNPTYECDKTTPNCTNPILVADALHKTCNGKQDVNHQPVYDSYTKYTATTRPCGT